MGGRSLGLERERGWISWLHGGSLGGGGKMCHWRYQLSVIEYSMCHMDVGTAAWDLSSLLASALLNVVEVFGGGAVDSREAEL